MNFKIAVKNANTLSSIILGQIEKHGNRTYPEMAEYVYQIGRFTTYAQAYSNVYQTMREMTRKGILERTGNRRGKFLLSLKKQAPAAVPAQAKAFDIDSVIKNLTASLNEIHSKLSDAERLKALDAERAQILSRL